MNVVFRVDASLLIGSGHVMRCLSLADALRDRGGECHFICRDHPGHLNDFIAQRGYSVHALAAGEEGAAVSGLAHGAWLGGGQEQDASEAALILNELKPDWLVIDHYALDIRWEQQLLRYCKKLMVIDDLADRAHACDLLLDQNLGRAREDYVALLPASGKALIGPEYALLRPEFAALRDYSLQRRQRSRLESILISMGGVDQTNATARVIEALRGVKLPSSCHVSIVMGAKAPWIRQVRALAAEMPWPTEVLVGVDNMGVRMANCDLAIGAAGSTSWERCCLGVPTLMAILADNQKLIGRALEKAGAAYLIDFGEGGGLSDCGSRVIELLGDPKKLSRMSRKAASITDGAGVESVVSWMMKT